MVAHAVGFLDAGILWHYQVQVNKALVARLAGTQFVKAYQLFGVFF